MEGHSCASDADEIPGLSGGYWSGDFVMARD